MRVPASQHPSYESGIANAVRRAASHPVSDAACFTVYYDGMAIYVRASEATPVQLAETVCIAQRWDADTVQLRFKGAHSEWVKI